MSLINPVPVSSDEFPYVCFLQVFYRNRPNQRFIGSGAFITPRAILTAGHVVFDRDLGNAVRVFATFGSEPRVPVKAEWADTSRQWIEKQKSPHTAKNPLSLFDLGVVILAQPAQIAALEVETITADELTNVDLNVAGFPAAPPGNNALGTLCGARARATANDGRLFYPINTLAGMSGGPAYTFDAAAGRRTIRAIHTSFVGGRGSALRITAGVLSLINEWKDKFA